MSAPLLRQSGQLRREKDQIEGTKNSAGINNGRQTNSNPSNNKDANKSNTNKAHINKITGNKDLSPHFLGPVAKPTTPQIFATLEPVQQTGHFLGNKHRWHKIKINDTTLITRQQELPRIRPKF